MFRDVRVDRGKGFLPGNAGGFQQADCGGGLPGEGAEGGGCFRASDVFRFPSLLFEVVHDVFRREEVLRPQDSVPFTFSDGESEEGVELVFRHEGVVLPLLRLFRHGGFRGNSFLQR